MNEYELNAGKILRKGEEIASYNQDTGQITFLPECDRYRGPVIKFLKAMQLPVATGGAVKVTTEQPADAAPEAENAVPEAPAGLAAVMARLEALEAENKRLKGNAAEAVSVPTLDQRIAEKVPFSSDKIFDPVLGHIRG